MSILDRFADCAEAHLDEPGPIDTCWSNGPERWADELGIPGLNTASVSSAEGFARHHVNGWRYVEGTAGLRRGHVADWGSSALGGQGRRHVTVVTDVDGSRWRGIGSGTPSGRVARQPSGGGWNPVGILRGYFVPPAPGIGSPAAQPAPAKPQEVTGDVYVVRAGDYLRRIARRHDTTVQALLRANPARRDGRSADFHIARADLIVPGQKIRLP